MISVICVYNNQEILNNFLIKSITQQSFMDYELILLDNRGSYYKSAVDALNKGAMQAKGDILLFIHQDVFIIDKDGFLKIEQFCNHFDFGVCGVAGVDINKRLFCSVVQGTKQEMAGEKAVDLTEVQTLDECMFFVKKTNFKGFEYIDNSWHLYAVTYSISCLQNNLKNYVLPIQVWHYSPGLSLDKTYFRTLKLYFKKHPNIKEIYCTMGCFKNNRLFSLYVIYRNFKICVFKKFKLGIWREQRENLK